MRSVQDALSRFWDRHEPQPRYTQYTHGLPVFASPKKGPVPDPLPQVALLTPCRDAVEDSRRFFALIEGLEYPKDRLHLRLLEGDPDADTFYVAKALLAECAGYASTGLLKPDPQTDVRRSQRREIGVKRARRAAIAACRNRLLRAGLETGAAWFLFVDVDMAVIPPGTLQDALRWSAPVLMANCLRHGGDRIFDLNGFRYTRSVLDRHAARFVRNALYQPPSSCFRHYPSPNSQQDIEPLNSVGGTFFLIRRDVIEAGANFSEEPYQMHIETEGFARIAADLGFGAFMPPRLIVRHRAH